MGKKLLLLPALALCALLSGAETVIQAYKDFTLDSAKNPKAKFIANGSYVYFKNAQKYAGKNIAFRAKITHVSGGAKLGGTFRCSTNPGNTLRFTKAFPVSAAVGKTVEFEAICPVPKLDNIYHFNMLLCFRQTGDVHNVWKIENPRFVEPQAAEIARNEKLTGVQPAASIGGAALTLNQKPLTLVKEGKLQFKIVVPDEQDEIVKYASKELADHLKAATGDTPVVVKESNFKGGCAIYVGNTKMAQKYGAAPAALAPENLIVARVGDAVILSGGDCAGIPYYMVPGRTFVAVGTLYAVYEFLESQLGIRWYWPGKIGTVIPACKNLTINNLFLSSHPDYDTRKTFYSIGKDPRVSRAEFEVWYRRNRFGGSIGDPVANHSFNDWIKRFSKTHPEYLALQADGSRKTVYEPGGGHVCMSNPDVLKQTIEDKVNTFKKNRYSNFAAVMPGDSNGIFYCRCAKCQAKVRPELGERALYSDAVWGFVNKAAAGVAARIPGKIITCCAYGDYLSKPSFPLLPNIAVTLCFSNMPRACESYKKQWKALQDEWKSTGARLYVWEYWNATRYQRGYYGAPAIYPRQLKEIYALDSDSVHGRAIELCDVNSDGQGIGDWADWLYDIQNLYTAGKLLWNRSFDVEKMLNEYYTNFFGPAAEPMREFHNEMEAAWLRAGAEPGKWDYSQCWTKCYPPAFVDRMMGLLKKACELSKGQEPYASRCAWLAEVYQNFDRNSRMFRGGSRKTNPATVKIPRTGDWSKALVCKDFTDSYNVYQQESATEMKLRHDGKKIYVKVDCTIPKGVATVNWAKESIGKRDGVLWNYESCEVFFCSGDEIYQFILGPENMLADYHHEGKTNGKPRKSAQSWNCPGLVFSAKASGDKWHGELEIPISELKFSKPGKNGAMRFNFYRNCHYTMPGEPSKWEQSCYLPVYGSFHNVERFGTVTLEK